MALSEGKGLSGWELIGGGVVGLVAAALIEWLPLWILGSAINFVLFPVALIALVAGIALVFVKSRRNQTG